MKEKQVNANGLTVSLALNVILILGWVMMARKQLSTPEPVPATGNAVIPTPLVAPLPKSPDASSASAEGAVVSGDWRDHIERMREMGVSEKALAAIVECDFDQHWKTREAETYKKYQDGEIELNDLAILNLEREMAVEKELKETLGSKAFLAWNKARLFFDLDVGALKLSDAESTQTYQFRKQLDDRFRELEISKLRKEIDPETYDELREEAQAQYDQQFRKLVGQDRYNQTRDGGLSAELKRGLANLPVSRKQMEELQDVEGSWGDKWTDLQTALSQGAMDSLEFEKEAKELRTERDLEIKDVIGDDAFDYYQKRKDSRYVEMTDFADSWRLSDQDIDYVYKMLRYYDNAATEYRLQLGGNVDYGSKDKVLSSFSSEISQALKDYLGEDKFHTLERNNIIRLD